MVRSSKSQTATEYIIILSVIILIAVVTAQNLGAFSGIGSEISTKKSDAKLMVGELAISRHVVGNDSSKVVIQNNNFQTIKITNISIGGTECETTQLPKTLSVGSSYKVSCTNINGTTGERYDLDTKITYENLDTSSTYEKSLGTMSGRVSGALSVDNTPQNSIECLNNSDCLSGETCIIGTTPSDNFCSDDVIMYLRFEEGSGTMAHDSSPNGYNATINGANFESAGLLGKSINFDYVTEYVELAAGAISEIPEGTLSFWAYPEGDNSKNMIFSLSYYGDPGYEFRLRFSDTSDDLYFTLGGDGGVQSGDHQGRFYTYDDSFTSDSWQHLVITWNGSESRIYLNGEPFGSGFSYSNSFTVRKTPLSLILGKYSKSTSYSYVGEIDEVLFFDKDLSESEIRTLYLSTGGDDSCTNVPCSDYCIGNTRYYSGSCSGGQCSYNSETCSGICASGSCFDELPTGGWTNLGSQKTLEFGAIMVAKGVGNDAYNSNCPIWCADNAPASKYCKTYTNSAAKWCECYTQGTVKSLPGFYDMIVQER